MRAAAEELVIHLDSPEGAVVRYGPVLYVVWRAPTPASPVREADEAVRALTRRYGSERKLLYVHRAPDTTSFSRHGDEARDAVMKHFDRTEPYFRAAALAIEATGFGGAAVRSITAGVMLVRRTAVKTKVFDDARAGLRWLATQRDPSTAFDPDAMIAGLRKRELCLLFGDAG
jgi:hypothetical protein